MTARPVSLRLSSLRLSSLPLSSLVLVAALLCFWQVITASGLVSHVFLPSPVAASQALATGLTRGNLGPLTLATIERMTYGWLLACLIGVALGALIGVSVTLRAWLMPTLEMLRPLPASSMVPVFIGLFGFTPRMVLAVIAFGSLWPVLLATVHGFASIEPRLVEVGQALRLSRASFIWKVGLPNALPDALAGMRLALTVSLILAIVGEMLTSQQGLGRAILFAARSFHSADLFAGVILLGLIGLCGNALLAAVERNALSWQRFR